MSSTSQNQSFDYSTLDNETRITVQDCTNEIQTRMLKTVEQVVAIGHQLQTVKLKLKHGQFHKWLKSELDIHPRQANRFILVAQQFNCDIMSQLQIAPTALYLLAELQTPETARKESIKRAEQGERITMSIAKEIVSRHKNVAGQIPASDNNADPVIPHQTKAQKQAEMDKPKSVQPKSEKISHLSFDPSALHILSTPSRPFSTRRDALQRDFEGERIFQKVTKEIGSQHKGDVDQSAEHIIIDIPAITILDESNPLELQTNPCQTTSHQISVGDRVRILRRQEGEDKWTGCTAKVWEVTPNGWLRVDVEEYKGVKFTLKPEWVELLEELNMTEPTNPKTGSEPDPVILEKPLPVRIPLEIEGKTIEIDGIINEVEVHYTHQGISGTVMLPANRVIFAKP